MKILKRDLKSYMIATKLYEAKLSELMPEDEFMDFIISVARDVFKTELEDMAEGDFKDFVLKHMEEITK